MFPKPVSVWGLLFRRDVLDEVAGQLLRHVQGKRDELFSDESLHDRWWVLRWDKLLVADVRGVRYRGW